LAIIDKRLTTKVIHRAICSFTDNGWHQQKVCSQNGRENLNDQKQRPPVVVVVVVVVNFDVNMTVAKSRNSFAGRRTVNMLELETVTEISVFLVVQALLNEYSPSNTAAGVEVAAMLDKVKWRANQSPMKLFEQLATIRNMLPDKVTDEQLITTMMANAPKEYKSIITTESRNVRA
jgi:hypothetical protein